MRILYRFIIINIIIIPVFVISSHATILTKVNENILVKESELIFQGTVVDVAYRMSDKVKKDDPRIPFTFVKFKIEKIFKGKAANKEFITLRFMGGSAGGKRRLKVLGIPLFDKGDNDILFVAGNTKSICPLIGWKQGRFRIIEKAVYSNSGQEVWLTDKRIIEFGKTHPFKEVISDKVGDSIIERKKSKTVDNKTQPIKGGKINLQEFTGFLNELISKHHTKKAIDSLPLVRNADIKDKLFYNAPKSVSPKGGVK